MQERHRIAIMQPYFLPYIGYWQLMDAADEMILHDNVQFPKGGWVNRNQLLVKDVARIFTLPLRKTSHKTLIGELQLAEHIEQSNRKVLRMIHQNYRRAPYFDAGMGVAESCFGYISRGLLDCIWHSLEVVRAYLNINTPLRLASEVDIDPSLTGQERVLSLCQACGATDYINPIGGMSLYDRETFSSRGIALHFQRVMTGAYPQFGDGFVDRLSVLDEIMFNSPEQLRARLQQVAWV